MSDCDHVVGTSYNALTYKHKIVLESQVKEFPRLYSNMKRHMACSNCGERL